MLKILLKHVDFNFVFEFVVVIAETKFTLLNVFTIFIEYFT